MKVRVYKTPTKAEPDRVSIGIPQAIQQDTSISSLEITQREILPAPKTIQDLFREPQEHANPSLSAFKNVGISKLQPGFEMVVRPIGTQTDLVAPAQVEEVTIPDGFIHLEDSTDWVVFNYNRAWQFSDRNFDVLPGEERLPNEYLWDILWVDRTLKPRFKAPIDQIRVYYRRISEIVEDYEWVDWIYLTDESIDFPYYGKFVFRAVPYHDGHPLPFQKEWTQEWEEPDTLSWSTIQFSKDKFQVRLEGVLGPKINYLEVFEGSKLVGQVRLQSDKRGRVEQSFFLRGISDDEKPELKYVFYRKVRSHKSFVEAAYNTLQRNYAYEDVSFNVQQNDTEFTINISDPQKKLYSPVNALNPFEGQQWTRAIQTGELLIQLEIIRHQDGEIRDYGRYFCNVTSENEPNWIESPPFKSQVTKISGGYSFKFEDTQEFRDVVNIDNPDLDKQVGYEFRLIYSTAGIEQCLRTGEDYLYIKETPILVRNKRSSYKYSYSVWKEEHPRKLYTGRIPVDVQYSYMGHHLRYGRSITGFFFNSGLLPIQKTKNIEVENMGWKVLYYYDDKEDSLVEHPYTTFQIRVPTSSQLQIDQIEVFIDLEDKNDISLGKFHPVDVIDVIDFLGYYEARKIITQKINVQKAFANLPKLNNDPVPTIPLRSQNKTAQLETIRNQPIKSMNVNTPAKKIDVKKSNDLMNTAISKQVETGTLKYSIEITYNDGVKAKQGFVINISDRPALPEEEEDNVSFTTGNKTLLPSTFQVPSSALRTFVGEIESTPVRNPTTFNTGMKR